MTKTIVRALALIAVSIAFWFVASFAAWLVNYAANSAPWYVGMIAFIALIAAAIKLVLNTMKGNN